MLGWCSGFSVVQATSCDSDAAQHDLDMIVLAFVESQGKASRESELL